VLSKAEAAQSEHPTAIAAIRLLLLTGCRLSEILTLQLAYVERSSRAACAGRTARRAKVVRLGAPALDLLAGLPRFQRRPLRAAAHPRRQCVQDRTRRVGAGHFVGLGRYGSA